MPRLMSVRLTEQAVRERRKTVTRRLGWRFLKSGDQLTLVRKAQGLKKGEKVERICDVEVISGNREPLHDVRRNRTHLANDNGHESPCGGCMEPSIEGFPRMTPDEFVDMFCREMRCTPDTWVTRIEWRYLEDE